MRLIIALGALVILSLQYKAWFSDVGFRATAQMRTEVDAERAKVTVLAARNQVLAAEIAALNSGADVMEARARLDLGMIRKGEVFLLVADNVR